MFGLQARGSWLAARGRCVIEVPPLEFRNVVFAGYAQSMQGSAQSCDFELTSEVQASRSNAIPMTTSSAGQNMDARSYARWFGLHDAANMIDDTTSKPEEAV